MPFAQMQSTIGVIILNWNNWSDTLNCIEQICNLTFPQELIKCIVVDNGSNDSSLEILSNVDEIHLIALQTNRGFAAGCNVGIRYAIQNSYEYVLLLNNDTILDPNFLSPLWVCLNSNPNIGLVGPKIYYDVPKNTIWYAGGKFLQPRIIAEMIGIGRVDIGQYDQPRRVDFTVGACMLIKTDVFERIGYLDETFFFYQEDVDFCYRAAQAGYTIYYQPESKIIHRVSSSTHGNIPYRTYLYSRSRTVFLMKHIRGLKIIPVVLLEFIRLIRVMVFNLFKLQPTVAYHHMIGIIHGINDWLKREIAKENIVPK